MTYHVETTAHHPMPADLPEQYGILSRQRVKPSHFKFPFINNCGIDAAGMVLNYLNPRLNNGEQLKPRDMDWKAHGKLIEFD